MTVDPAGFPQTKGTCAHLPLQRTRRRPIERPHDTHPNSICAVSAPNAPSAPQSLTGVPFLWSSRRLSFPVIRTETRNEDRVQGGGQRSLGLRSLQLPASRKLDGPPFLPSNDHH